MEEFSMETLIMRSWKLKVLSIAASIALAMFFAWYHFSFTTGRLRCRNYLYSMRDYVQLYRETHEGNFPENLFNVEDGLLSSLHRCPAARCECSETRYIYSYWPPEIVRSNLSEISRFPLVYDGSLDNHRGRGVNVLLVDGTVLWDENAGWLRAFSDKYPTFKIGLPAMGGGDTPRQSTNEFQEASGIGNGTAAGSD